MPIGYADYSRAAVEDVVRLRRKLDGANIPPRRTDHNFLLGTWNLRAFGRVHRDWTENAGSPKRNLRAMAGIAEIIRRFDVVAIQEVKRETEAIRMLVSDFLGPNWEMIVSDVTAGDAGNVERLAYVYDRRRDLALRSALGAGRRRIVTGVVGRAALLSGVGALIGMLGAAASGKVIAAFLFQVEPLDPVTFGAA